MKRIGTLLLLAGWVSFSQVAVWPGISNPTSMIIIGDSLDYGSLATAPAYQFWHRVATPLGIMPNIVAVPGSQALEITDVAYRQQASGIAGQWFGIGDGTNATYKYGANPTLQAVEYASLQAAMAFLATLNNHTRAAQMNKTGSWSPNSEFGSGISFVSTHTGDTASCEFQGNVLYWAYGIWSGGDGQALLYVDGQQMGLLNASSSADVRTNLGKTSGSILARLPLGGNRSDRHVAKVRLMSAHGSGFSSEFCAGNGQVGPDSPRVIVRTMPYNISFDPAIQRANIAQAKAAGEQLAEDGLNVAVIDVSSPQDFHETTLAAAVKAGATSVTVASALGLVPGMQVGLPGANQEFAVIASNYVRGSTTVTLVSAGTKPHDAGDWFLASADINNSDGFGVHLNDSGHDHVAMAIRRAISPTRDRHR